MDIDNKEKPGHTLHHYRHPICRRRRLNVCSEAPPYLELFRQKLKGQFHQPLLFYQTHWHLIVAVML